MTFAPVLIREFREEARRPAHCWVRVGVAAVLAVIFCTLAGSRNPSAGKIFGSLHTLLFFSLWVVVPVMTADCISRERREGTLGLLFLTPLTPAGVVVGKSALQVIRGLTLVIAALPMFAGCFVIGGVTWFDVAASLLLNLTALLLALSAGILASALSVQWARTLIVALAFSGLCFAGLLTSWASAYTSNFPLTWTERFLLALDMCTDSEDCWGKLVAMSGSAAIESTLSSFALRLTVAAGVFFLVLLAAGFAIRRASRDRPPGRRQIWFTRFFFAPAARNSLAWWLARRKLERAPLSWLQQRSWNARLTKWGWCLVTVLTQIICTTMAGYGGYLRFQPVLVTAMLLGMSLAAADSFRTERQNGVLELLLITPASEGELIRSRVWNVWLQFVPAVVILLGFDLLTVPQQGLGTPPQTLWPWFAISAINVPLAGIYFALRTRHFITSWLATVVCSLALPYLLGYWLFPRDVAGTLVTGMIVAFILLYRAQCNLIERRFVLH